jgi:hypothetical protein
LKVQGADVAVEAERLEGRQAEAALESRSEVDADRDAGTRSRRIGEIYRHRESGVPFFGVSDPAGEEPEAEHRCRPKCP